MSSVKKNVTNNEKKVKSTKKQTKNKNLDEEVAKVLETIDDKDKTIDDKENPINKESKEDKKQKKSLDLTTRIRIDRARLNDTGTLDTSFLDKNNKNVSKKDIIVEEKFLNKVEEKKPHKILKGIVLLIVSILIGFLSYYISAFYINKPEVKTKIKVKTKEVEKVVIDENILFLGDEITKDFDIDAYFKDYFVVNSGEDDNTTKDILDNLAQRVYQYNPSKVFIMIGTNDLVDEDISNDDIVNNIRDIIKEIQGNRPYAKIYVESVYPINESDDDKIDEDVLSDRRNKEIKQINEMLEELAEELEVTYIDVYSELLNEDSELDLDFTTDGFHISDEGYEKISDVLQKYIEE